MLRQFFYPVFLGMLLASCGGNNTKVSQKDSAKTVAKDAEKQPATVDKVIASDAETAISETNRNTLLLFGKTIEVQSSELQSLLPQTVIEMNLMMTNAGAVAKGPLTFAYLTKPGNGSQKIFIGQPVGARFDSDNGFDFITVPGGTYYKMQCSAETGQTAPFHQKMQEALQQHDLSFDLPVLEIFSESRNNEMTVVSRATLLYPKK